MFTRHCCAEKVRIKIFRLWQFPFFGSNPFDIISTDFFPPQKQRLTLHLIRCACCFLTNRWRPILPPLNKQHRFVKNFFISKQHQLTQANKERGEKQPVKWRISLLGLTRVVILKFPVSLCQKRVDPNTFCVNKP